MIGKRVKEVMAEKGVTSKQLAESMGLSTSGLSIMLSEKGNPTLLSLKKIAEYLDVPLYEIFTEPKSHDSECCPYCGHKLRVILMKDGK